MRSMVSGIQIAGENAGKENGKKYGDIAVEKASEDHGEEIGKKHKEVTGEGASENGR